MKQSTIITGRELSASGDRAKFVADAINRYRQSELYRNAVSASNYMRQRNETINRFIKKLFTALVIWSGIYLMIRK